MSRASNTAVCESRKAMHLEPLQRRHGGKGNLVFQMVECSMIQNWILTKDLMNKIIKQAKVLPTLHNNMVMLLKYEALWNSQGEIRVL